MGKTQLRSMHQKGLQCSEALVQNRYVTAFRTYPLSSDDILSLFEGLPEYNVAPFDPHKASVVEQYRGDRDGLAGYHLQLLNVSEYGWSDSEVTKYKTDYKNNRIIYSQYFPEKSLDGHYSFQSKMLGQSRLVKGIWNLTLYDYSQTTTVTRLGDQGGLLKVRVEIDRIGDMKLHISDLFHGAKFIGM